MEAELFGIMGILEKYKIEVHDSSPLMSSVFVIANIKSVKP